MIARRLSLVLGTVALLHLPFAPYCSFCLGPNLQSTQRDGSMPCAPADQSHGCCTLVASVQEIGPLPSAGACLSAPLVVLADESAIANLDPLPLAPLAAREAERPPPQDLYTLYACLLI